MSIWNCILDPWIRYRFIKICHVILPVLISRQTKVKTDSTILQKREVQIKINDRCIIFSAFQCKYHDMYNKNGISFRLLSFVRFCNLSNWCIVFLIINHANFLFEGILTFDFLFVEFISLCHLMVYSEPISRFGVK